MKKMKSTKILKAFVLFVFLRSGEVINRLCYACNLSIMNPVKADITCQQYFARENLG